MGKYGERTSEQIQKHIQLMEQDIERVEGQIERNEVGPDPTWAYERRDRYKAELMDLLMELSGAQEREVR